MRTLLQLDSSADATNSRTRRLTARFAEVWQSRGAEYAVVVRDLHAQRLPHMTSTAQHWPPRLRGGIELDAVVESTQADVLEELMNADAVVIGAPMYNYSMPSTLKAWVDLIHVPGITAPFDSVTQPLAGRPAVVISARGAAYDVGTPQAMWDHVTPPLALVLGGALGMEVHVVTVDRTLADLIPALERDKAVQSLEAAETESVRLALSI